ncbi:Reticulocyte-binding protein 2 homolog a [Durusdinium trenchii]|uniref:Reticulocyte-binding protein 2 homolog a n=1 Tax=Durusdinium trenchii TaxID=1381693 RepID=A0ABP0IZ06_9DINO
MGLSTATTTTSTTTTTPAARQLDEVEDDRKLGAGMRRQGVEEEKDVEKKEVEGDVLGDWRRRTSRAGPDGLGGDALGKALEEGLSGTAGTHGRVVPAGVDWMSQSPGGTRVRLHRSGSVDIAIEADDFLDESEDARSHFGRSQLDERDAESAIAFMPRSSFSTIGSPGQASWTRAHDTFDRQQHHHRQQHRGQHRMPDLGDSFRSSGLAAPFGSMSSTMFSAAASGISGGAAGSARATRPPSPPRPTTPSYRREEETHSARGGTIVSVPSRSAAVISAMNALQDKIRRLERELDLEQERNLALKSEMEHMRQQKQNKIADLKGQLSTSEQAMNEEQTHRVRLEGELKLEQRECERLRGDHAAAEAKVLELRRQAEQQRDELEEARQLLAESKVEAESKAEMAERRQEELQNLVDAEREARSQVVKDKEETDEFLQSLVQINQELVEKLAKKAEREAKTPAHAASKRPTAAKGPRLATTRRAKQRTEKNKRPGGGPRRGAAASTRGVNSKQSSPAPVLSEGVGVHGLSLDKQLLRANLGKPVPFLLGKNPGPSFSLYGQVQQGISDDQAFGRASSAGSLQADQEYQEEHDRDRDEPKRGAVISVRLESPKGGRQRADSEIGSLVGSLREELEGLQAEYQATLASVSNEDISRGIPTETSESLGDLVERIETKAQQLFLLQQHEQHLAQSRSRSPVRSPKAFKRKVRALRTLHKFRLEENES